jgi:DNA-binding IclR family transcriptional regulator
MPRARSAPPAPPAAPDDAPATGSSAARSLRLLAVLAEAGRPLALADLAERVALPKGTAHRLCLHLLELGWLARDADERLYAVGPALRALAFATLNHASVRGLRHDVLARLVAEIGETCNFTTQDGTEVLYLDRVEAKWPLRLTLDVGSHVPLHCTASGKLFLALMPEVEREAVLAHLALPRMTRTTLTTVKALREECRAIAAQGYSCDREEFIAGLVAVAVPVTPPGSAVRAAVAVHAPIARLSMEAAIARLPALRAAARRMGELL